MKAASEILRRHRRYRCRLLVPPALFFSSSRPLSNFSSPVPFYQRNSAANPYHPSRASPLFSNYIAYRSFSWFTWRNSAEMVEVEGNCSERSEGRLETSPTEILETASEQPSLSYNANHLISEDVFCDNSWYSYPIQAVISMLDGFHDITGLPWWVVISISTLALRASLLPVLVLQLKKMAKFGTLLPRLPPPFPPLGSERSFREQYQLFHKKRRELGCPSYLWNFAFFAAQLPCFLLWMSSIRRMCLDHHPGFDNGGTLWFLNLSDYPRGITCFTFPIMVAGLHYINVQISFQSIKFTNLQGLLGLLAKFYKLYLDILSIPLFIVGFYIPQGSLIYWVTNSLLTLTQQLCLKNPTVRNKLGLPNLMDPMSKRASTENDQLNSAAASEILIPIEVVPPKKLLELAFKDMEAGDRDKALILFRKATEKDPELAQALVAMGQILCSKKLFEEAAENFELAISKLSYQTKEEEIGLLVLSLFGAGVSRIWQGRNSDGIEHLKKIAELREPDSPMDKACYYRGLVMLGSTLFQLGEKSEAAKYLRIAATYDPGVNAYLKECEG